MWRRLVWSRREVVGCSIRQFSRRHELGVTFGLNQQQSNNNDRVFGVFLPAAVLCYREPKVHLLSHFVFRQLATSSTTSKETMQGTVTFNVAMEHTGGGAAIEAGKRAAAWAAVDELVQVSGRSVTRSRSVGHAFAVGSCRAFP